MKNPLFLADVGHRRVRRSGCWISHKKFSYVSTRGRYHAFSRTLYQSFRLFRSQEKS